MKSAKRQASFAPHASKSVMIFQEEYDSGKNSNCRTAPTVRNGPPLRCHWALLHSPKDFLRDRMVMKRSEKSRGGVYEQTERTGGGSSGGTSKGGRRGSRRAARRAGLP